MGTFESRILLDDNFDPDYFLLARDNNALVGCILGAYAKRMPLGDADPNGTRSWITALAVDPLVDMTRVGGMLLRELGQKFAAIGKTECFVSTYPPGYFTPGVDQNNSTSLLKCYLDNGYIKVREALSMDSSIVLFQAGKAVEEKEKQLRQRGIQIRPYRREDLLRFLKFLELTMPSDWVRVERRNLKKMSEGGFNENQITVVAHEDEIIGYCQFEGSHFGPFGVSDKYQGQGIGTVLLARTIERMKTEGFHDAWVMWTDDLAAKVYGKFGFKETRRFAILRKEFH
jgi:predicted N-acetyltransferase YhbS